MEVSAQPHATTTLPPGKQTPLPNGQEAGLGPVTVWKLLETSYSYQVSNSGRPARSPSLYTCESEQAYNLKNKRRIFTFSRVANEISHYKSVRIIFYLIQISS
jgi:hypothetical protein